MLVDTGAIAIGVVVDPLTLVPVPAGGFTSLIAHLVLIALLLLATTIRPRLGAVPILTTVPSLVLGLMIIMATLFWRWTERLTNGP